MDLPNELLKKIVERSGTETGKIFMLRIVSKRMDIFVTSSNFDITIKRIKRQVKKIECLV